MIELIDIKREGTILSAFVTTGEKGSQTFEVAIDVESLKIVKNTVGRMDMNVGIAVAKLFKLVELEVNENIKRLPKSEGSTWY